MGERAVQITFDPNTRGLRFWIALRVLEVGGRIAGNGRVKIAFVEQDRQP